MEQLSKVAERLAALEQRTRDPAPTSAPEAPASLRAEASTKQEEKNYDSMMSSLLRRLDAHQAMVSQDQGLEVTPERAEADAPMAAPSEEVSNLVRELEGTFRDMREAAAEKLRAFAPVSWTIGHSKARCAPEMVARIYRNGRSCEDFVKAFIREKELEGNHLGNEMQLLALMVDRALCESPPSWINYQTTEVVFRRLHGIERAFATVSKEADWRAPKGAKNWKTRVQYALLDEIGARKITENNTVIDSIDKEVRERLQQKALLHKSLNKVTGSGEGAGGE